ncbi:MAG TPA: hypothetical protein VEB63_02155 [Chitinophagaceae bacterium]|nr:hypothetical protein [Chitinophagaceae bacterium]
MKNSSLTPVGALHPILFFAGVYLVALIFSVFICSALFYSCNGTASEAIGEEASQPAIGLLPVPENTVATR